MKNKYSPEYRTQRKWTLWLFVALLCALLLNSLAGDYFRRIFFSVLTGLSPVLIGLILTFLLKKLLDFLEKKVFKKWFSRLKNGDKVNRIFCITLLFLALFAIIFLILFMLIPKVVEFINGLNGEVIGGYVNNLKTQLTEFFESTGLFNDVDVEATITDFINKLGDSLATNIPLIAESVVKVIQQTAQMFMYFVVGVVISIVMLYKKENITSFSKRICYATLSQQRADKLIKTAKFADQTLYDYVTGKILESFIVFAILLPGLLIFKVPSPFVVAGLFAFFNMIPYFGGVVGCIGITLLCIATINFSTAIWVLLYVIAVTNIYGYFFGPLIFGKRLKVSSLLIILSLVVFGSIFGVVGMFFGPPIMAVLWKLLNQFVADKENEKIELEKYGLETEDINDLEILQEAKNIVQKRREEAKNINTKQE